MFYSMVPISFPRSSRPALWRFRLVALGAAGALYCTGASAQTNGLEAYNAYVAGLKSLGFTIENGAIDYDGTTDTLTISNADLGLNGTIADLRIGELDKEDSAPKSDPPEGTNLTYEMSLSSETVSIVGLTEDNNVFSAKSWTYSDDTSLAVSATLKGEGRFKIDGRLSGAAAENYHFTMPSLPAIDPARQASRWLPFFKTALLASYDEIRVDSTALTLEAYAQKGDSEFLAASGTMQFDGYKMAGADNGRVALYSLDKLTQTLQTRDVASDEMIVQTTTQGKTIYEDVDVNPLAALLDPAVAETGDKQIVIRHGSMVDYSNRQDLGDGLAFQMTVDRSSLNDFTLVKRDNDVLALLDNLLNGQMPEPEKLITGLFQIYRSFGVADARVSGINLNVTAPDEDMAVNVAVKEAAVTDFSSNGIGEMMIVGVDAPDLPDGASLSLEWGAIGGIEFADYGPMETMIAALIQDPDYGEDNPLDVVRAFMPYAFGYEVEGLKVVVPDSGPMEIGRAEMKVSTTVPPIPTSYYVKNDGVKIPVTALDDMDMEEFLSAIGVSEIVLSDETRLYWDEATQELHLERLKLDMEGVGTAVASARFGNVPKALFEDPEGQAQMALVVAQFIEAEVKFTDDGVTENGLAHVAGAQNIPVSVFREALAEQAAEATAPIQNTAFTDMVRTAVSDFLKDPREITLTLAPSAPVPLAQIVGSMAAPQALPDLLNVQIKAN